MHNFFRTALINIVFKVFIWNLFCVMLLAWPMKTQYYLYLSKRNAFVESVDLTLEDFFCLFIRSEIRSELERDWSTSRITT